MKLIKRFYWEKSQKILKNYPILCLLGPRQCGKTTFAKEYFKEFDYYDLERPSHESQIGNDIELFLKNRKKSFIIDEAQRLPELFSALRSFIDQKKFKGKIVLLGSSNFNLIKSISESLAGRIGYIDLTFFNIREITFTNNFEIHWLKGGFPDAFLKINNTELNFDWFENYTRSLIERDWPSHGIELNAPQFRRLWTMLSLSHGNILNKNKLATSMGISPHTIERYIDILEQSFLIKRLTPYSSNLKKRLIKSPKIYIRDSGLLHYFLKILNFEDLYVSPSRGVSFEGYVIEQIIEIVKLFTPQFDPFFFRSADGLETDLLLQKGNIIVPIEIKSKSRITNNDIKSLIKVMQLLNLKKGYVIYMGDESYTHSSQIDVISFSNWFNANANIFWN